MWIEEEPGKRVNERRVEQVQEAIGAGPAMGKPGIVASACPFCMTSMKHGSLAANSLHSRQGHSGTGGRSHGPPGLSGFGYSFFGPLKSFEKSESITCRELG